MNKSYSKLRHIQEANERLEKRFLKEDVGPTPSPSPAGQTYKVKYFDSEEAKKQGVRSGNIDVSNLKLVNNNVEFEYNIAGASNKDAGTYYCDKGNVSLGNTMPVDTNTSETTYEYKYLSDEGNKIFQQMCNQYASTGTNQNNTVA